MIVYPEIDPVAFGIGPIKVHWYGLTYLAGFTLSFLFARSRARREDAPIRPAQVEDLIFAASVSSA